MREEGDRSRDEGGDGARAEPGRGAALVLASKGFHERLHFVERGRECSIKSIWASRLKPVVSLS